MLKLWKKIEFSWLNLVIMASCNLAMNSIFLFLYKKYPWIIFPVLLLLCNVLVSAAYCKMLLPILPQNKVLKILTLFLLFTPFLALPLLILLSLKSDSNKQHPFVSKSKFILVLAGSLMALFISLSNSPFIGQRLTLFCRILPPEVSYPIISSVESKQVSAITPFEAVITPCAVKKILSLRTEFSVTSDSAKTLNPLRILNFLPMGFSWVRGAPIQAFSLLQFHLIQR